MQERLLILVSYEALNKTPINQSLCRLRPTMAPHEARYARTYEYGKLVVIHSLNDLPWEPWDKFNLATHDFLS